MKAMFGGDAFSDTFGDLNLWEALTLQLMAATGGTEMSEEEFRARLQKHAEDRHHKLVEALVKKIASFVRKDIEQFKKEMDADVAEKVSVEMMCICSKTYFFLFILILGRCSWWHWFACCCRLCLLPGCSAIHG